jgi:hypothetical protein
MVGHLQNHSILKPQQFLLVMLLIGLFSGCSGPQGPEVLTIEPTQYNQAFDAALQACRSTGMPAVFRDRRSGIIESDPRIAGSILEPWRTDNDGVAQAFENTIGLLRREARFEFTPIGHQLQGGESAGESAVQTQPAHSIPPAQPQNAAGPDMVAGTPEIDLTNYQGPIELRVWVYTERAHTFGNRRSTWSRSKTSQSKIKPADDEPPVPNGTFWTAQSRDPAYERRLMGMIQQSLSAAANAPDSQR